VVCAEVFLVATEPLSKLRALRDLAKTLAAADPDRAERIAHSITDEFEKALALSGIAKALAATSS
jgi:hypothetical protein